jgi:hypothetical protein
MDGAFTRSSASGAAIQTAGDISQEINMLTLHPLRKTPTIRFEFLNWVATDPMPRDQTQSQLLHEPDHRINSSDPMNGHDIENITTHPSLVDGNLTIYFESESTRSAYQDMPLNHPNSSLPFKASNDDDRGG